jgi:tRNA 2-selenouridine synthase
MKSVKQIEPSELWEWPDWPILDVRTPAEYAKGHIPGAFNLPLFSNEERAQVGTLYKQVSPQEALLKGLELVGPKMRQLVEEAGQMASNRQVIVHCWRGGNRSGSLGWLLNLAGFEVKVIRGGYKAFRKTVLGYLQSIDHSFIVLGGKTGIGKTDLLDQLAAKGRQVVDLEGLARHKGSAFGGINEQEQPTVEHFENLLYHELNKLDLSVPTWLEHESRSIGRVYLPQGLLDAMHRAPFILLNRSIDFRVKKLVKEYGKLPTAALIDAFDRIRKRLGGQHHKRAVQALEQGDIEQAALIALTYYDKAYEYYLQREAPASISVVEGDDLTEEAIVAQFIHLEQERYELKE